MTTQDRTHREDALKHLHESEYAGHAATPDSVAGALGIAPGVSSSLLDSMSGAGLVREEDGGWWLTPEGRDYARRVLRAHRLVETYLARETSLPPDSWHAQAERREHQMTQAEVDALANHLGRPRFDPHGDPIPTRKGELPPASAVSLASWPAGETARISHIEDEPPDIFRYLTSRGLAPGQILVITDHNPQFTGIDAQGLAIRLTPSQAAQISVVAAAITPQAVAATRRLSQIPLGQTAHVTGIAPACRGPERTRLLDLGVVPGSTITPELRGISSSPVAYRVRGTLIALRKEQSELILVEST